MTKSIKFKKEYAVELLNIAEQDLETAQTLIAARLKRKENILFHIEQAIEKALKASLCRFEIPVPMVHEISILIDRLPEGVSPPRSEDLVDLTQFATIRRYEEGRADFTEGEVKAAYDLAKEVIAWAQKIR